MMRSLNGGEQEPQRSLRDATPAERIASLADPGTVSFFPPAGPSPHLARFGIAAHDDDGVVIARARVNGAAVLVAAQDQHYLAGSVGERHGAALQSMITAARHERPAAIVLLLASGGVRLHEANAAELALARVLSSILDARVDGIAVIAIGVASVFGGASVLACAADRLALLPGTRFGLSGPKVLESVHGKWALDADDERDVDGVFGAAARNATGFVELVTDDADALRAWIARAVAECDDFAGSVIAMHRRLGARIAGEAAPAPPFEALSCFDGAEPVDDAGRLWRRRECWLTRPNPGTTLGPADAHALDSALLASMASTGRGERTPLVIVEDSAGHAVSRAAEMRMISQFLAHHAAVLALIRARGRRLIGALVGVGHSAAFFSNALQAPVLYALPSSRVVAMDPSSVARVTGLSVDSMTDGDALLGHPVRHFASVGGVTAIIREASLSELGVSQ